MGVKNKKNFFNWSTTNSRKMLKLEEEFLSQSSALNEDAFLENIKGKSKQEIISQLKTLKKK